LISITGGKDLTLFEVDEAATRIREEVDQDANIIVGATFDESLDGIIRVSVVATGIDNAVAARPANAPETRLADLTKLRTDQRQIDRIERTDRPERVERIEPRLNAAPQPQPHQQHAATRPMNTAPHAAVENAAKAAVAAAVTAPTAIEDVTIRPLQPKPSLFPEPAPEAYVPEAPPQGAFIPPAAERPVSRTPRMPRFDELPMIAQNELRAKRGDVANAEPAEKGRMGGLLQRLAAVGLGGRREDEGEARPNPRPAVRPAPRTAAPMPVPQRPAPRPPESRQGDPVSEYAKRPTHQGLDPLGRQAPAHSAGDEDHLDIPAFLRRQAN
jgi:cell division protein FtsZ